MTLDNLEDDIFCTEILSHNFKGQAMNRRKVYGRQLRKKTLISLLHIPSRSPTEGNRLNSRWLHPFLLDQVADPHQQGRRLARAWRRKQKQRAFRMQHRLLLHFIELNSNLLFFS
ncbi:hypothetical protein D3C77_367300 [compost metagenome]